MAHVISEHRRETDAALEMLDRVVEISPGYLDDVVSRAVLNARIGNEVEATREIERVLAQRRDGKTVIQAACVYALLAAEKNDEGNDNAKRASYEKRAIALVGEAITIDAKWLSVITRDPDLASIRHNRDFKSIVTAAARLQRAVRNAKHELGPE